MPGLQRGKYKGAVAGDVRNTEINADKNAEIETDGKTDIDVDINTEKNTDMEADTLNRIRTRIEELRRKMQEYQMDYYIVPTADFHQSEYVGDYFKAREYLTGFTGSAGTAFVTKEQAFLWTDGRYFLQAESQLRESGIQLQKMGEPDVPTVLEFLKSELGTGENVGLDGRCFDKATGEAIEKIVNEKEGQLLFEQDLIHEIWMDCPKLPMEPAFLLEEQYAGESAEQKIARIREKMQEKGATSHLLTSLDDIAWLFNIRGNDVAYCPFVLAYALVTDSQIRLYAEEEKFSEKLKEYLFGLNVELCPYEQIYEEIATLSEKEKLLLDPARVNYSLYRKIPESVKKIESANPEVLMKCVKNPVEAENEKQAHLKDGIAHTKFMYWLKKQVGKERITEISAAEKLEALRKAQGDFLEPSFAPISAYGAHGAIVHYSATEETDVELQPRGLYLTDTGGHYLQGSTDVTRTIALGDLTKGEKEDFTIVLAGALNLADAVFKKGCSGASLDYAARAPFWKYRKDFNHGTGHGVGHLGNVHEPPIAFHWNPRRNQQELLENMIITDEPGIYIEGKYGIRTENELIVCKDTINVFGEFLKFEILTLVPIDLDAIDLEYLSEEQCELLNRYHKRVWEKISPYLEAEEKEWLKEYTREIHKN